jgi:hypothetical protein
MTCRFVPLHGVSLWFISFPVQVAQYDQDPPNAVTYVGVAVLAVGLLVESVGDLQLARFKSIPANRGEVLDHGLWRYAWHPNYFGDACGWCGLWLLAADSWLGVATVICPLMMNYLLVHRADQRFYPTATFSAPADGRRVTGLGFQCGHSGWRAYGWQTWMCQLRLLLVSFRAWQAGSN